MTPRYPVAAFGLRSLLGNGLAAVGFPKGFSDGPAAWAGEGPILRARTNRQLATNHNVQALLLLMVPPYLVSFNRVRIGLTFCRPCSWSVLYGNHPPSFCDLENPFTSFRENSAAFHVDRRPRSQSNCQRKVDWIELVGRERGIAPRREEETFPPHRSTCRGPASTPLSATVRRTGYRLTRSPSEGTNM